MPPLCRQQGQGLPATHGPRGGSAEAGRSSGQPEACSGAEKRAASGDRARASCAEACAALFPTQVPTPFRSQPGTPSTLQSHPLHGSRRRLRAGAPEGADARLGDAEFPPPPATDTIGLPGREPGRCAAYAAGSGGSLCRHRPRGARCGRPAPPKRPVGRGPRGWPEPGGSLRAACLRRDLALREASGAPAGRRLDVRRLALDTGGSHWSEGGKQLGGVDPEDWSWSSSNDRENMRRIALWRHVD